MPRKQFLTIKCETEDFDFNELFPSVDECPFSSLSTIDSLPLEIQQTQMKTEPDETSEKGEKEVPPLWYIEKGLLDEKQANGMQDEMPEKTFEELGESKAEIMSSFLGHDREVEPDVAIRAEQLMEKERNIRERFLQKVMAIYPVDKSYHPSKARKYTSSETENEDENSRDEERRNNNGKSLESRHKKKVERAINAYTILHLRERILTYQARLNIMKEMLLQENILSFDDSSNGEPSSSGDQSSSDEQYSDEYIDSAIASLSSVSSESMISSASSSDSSSSSELSSYLLASLYNQLQSRLMSLPVVPQPSNMRRSPSLSPPSSTSPSPPSTSESSRSHSSEEEMSSLDEFDLETMININSNGSY